MWCPNRAQPLARRTHGVAELTGPRDLTKRLAPVRGDLAGYGDKREVRQDPRAPGLREPAGEPRVTRMSRPQPRDTRIDVEVPEFIPRY